MIPPHPKAQRPNGVEDGVALLVVLWFLALLTLLAMGAATMGLLNRRAAQTLGDTVQAETAADSAIRIVLLQLAGRGQTWTSWLNGGTRIIHLGGATVQIRVELEDGRIDLNAGSRKLLYALFAANGWSPSDAAALVGRIDGWTDPPADLRSAAAERHVYRVSGRSYGPRDAPFESVGELRQVLGGAQISDTLMGALTVYTHEKYPLQSAAPPAVRRALAWADQRRLGGRRWLVKTQKSAIALDSLVATSAVGRLVRIHACAMYLHARRCRVVVVRITGNDKHLFEIFLWQSEIARQ